MVVDMACAAVPAPRAGYILVVEYRAVVVVEPAVPVGLVVVEPVVPVGLVVAEPAERVVLAERARRQTSTPLS